MNKVLIVVDMQNDFVTGSLGTAEAQSIVPNVVAKVQEYVDNGGKVLFTRDTHSKALYAKSLEGQKLPVPHCLYGEEGWKIIPELKPFANNNNTINKSTFGDLGWGDKVMRKDEVEIIGVCTDICVVSNALILRAIYPNMPITVDASCCAGTSPESHAAALNVMASCQLDIINN